MDVKPISGDEFDRRFDDGEDMADFIDWGARPVGQMEQVVVELPAHLIAGLDAAARKAGVSRQVLVESWIKSELAKEPLAA